MSLDVLLYLTPAQPDHAALRHAFLHETLEFTMVCRVRPRILSVPAKPYIGINPRVGVVTTAFSIAHVSPNELPQSDDVETALDVRPVRVSSHPITKWYFTLP